MVFYSEGFLPHMMENHFVFSLRSWSSQCIRFEFLVEGCWFGCDFFYSLVLIA